MNVHSYLYFLIFENRCGDNVDYGYRFGRDFVDTPEREVNPNIIDSPISFINTNQTDYQEKKRKPQKRGRIRRQMNVHNNEVGRRVNKHKIDYFSIDYLFVHSFIHF